ncbi:hypothetical protein CGMCC3_g7350 [Colletotrichum fructicola]|nr:uncharacterized protein CGMCC3_g7350 [Colletotrichum fructicola]KAE9576606.1 hypothetical protein CGMCC3_g7350 [Colletotrichum fructicola]
MDARGSAAFDCLHGLQPRTLHLHQYSAAVSLLQRYSIDRQGRKNTHLFSPTLCFPARGFNRSQAGGSRHARVRRLSFSDCLVQF